ncbi:MAG: histidine kinase [Rhodothermaceae bacterium]|nr:histidine kinase [Rhodothermaceae bacterium]
MDTTLTLPTPAPSLARTPRATPVPPGRAALMVLGLWSIPAAVALGQAYLEQILTARPVDWHHTLWTTLPNWYLWAFLTPLVLVLARRFAPGRASVATLIPVHAAGLVGLLGLHALGSVAVFAIAGLPADWTWGTFWTHYTIRFHVNALAYGLAVAVVWTVDARQRAQERERNEAALRTELAEAELRALKMQLRPHFLFNTLHAIGATVRKGETDHAIGMLTRLGDLLRLALEHDGSQEVPLRQELDLLERYLDLEAIRFGDRLTTTIEADPEARAALVPSWIVQPLVENALKHAIAPDPGPGHIAIRARRETDRLIVDVQDSGPGLGRSMSRAPSHGVGLANTRSRLAKLYGAAASLDLLSDDGLCARLTLPYQQA